MLSCWQCCALKRAQSLFLCGINIQATCKFVAVWVFLLKNVFEIPFQPAAKNSGLAFCGHILNILPLRITLSHQINLFYCVNAQKVNHTGKYKEEHSKIGDCTSMHINWLSGCGYRNTTISAEFSHPGDLKYILRDAHCSSGLLCWRWKYSRKMPNWEYTP